MTTGLFLPVRVGDGAPAIADDLVVPAPGLGVDGFSHGSQDSYEERSCLFTGSSPCHQGSDGRRRRVEHGDFVRSHHLPVPARVRVGTDSNMTVVAPLQRGP